MYSDQMYAPIGVLYFIQKKKNSSDLLTTSPSSLTEEYYQRDHRNMRPSKRRGGERAATASTTASTIFSAADVVCTEVLASLAGVAHALTSSKIFQQKKMERLLETIRQISRSSDASREQMLLELTRLQVCVCVRRCFFVVVSSFFFCFFGLVPTTPAVILCYW